MYDALMHLCLQTRGVENWLLRWGRCIRKQVLLQSNVLSWYVKDSLIFLSFSQIFVIVRLGETESAISFLCVCVSVYVYR